ncbi:hypothetical protein M0G43_03190 [Subsaxibacter sp. CAU 1640]|uniref:hypothetical protein n=1 Tax=Subsaxibacter sp. CAU 1640 TaxID=2933271 RepID=UPI00200595A8|nr:hypothetical protein [Subsaxibacter sp. CAU 1640]MCK7589572.1 hypothetical protein [Subsaxibacter sp. CAU 1640]
MSDKKHIDRLFQEKLKDFEVSPDDSVWDNIHDRLHNDKRNRKVIPLWWKLAGVAALIALLLTVGINFFSNDSAIDNKNIIVDTENPSSENSKTTIEDNATELETNPQDKNNSSKIANEEIDFNSESNTGEDGLNSNDFNRNTKYSNHKNTSKSSYTNVADNSVKNSNLKKNSETSDRLNVSSQNDRFNSTADAVTFSTKDDQKLNNSENQKIDKDEADKLIKDLKNNSDSAVTNNSSEISVESSSKEGKKENKTTQSIEDAIAEANNEDEKEKKLNRWNISPNVAPVYFNSLGKGSTIDEQFVDNTKTSEISMSYGLGGSYAINDRLKVRAGINKVGMGYKTNNVIAFRSIDSTSRARTRIANVNMDPNASDMTYMSTETLDSNITPEVVNSKSKGSIDQQFGFIEVPLEVEYALVNKRFGINVIGGFSTLFVDENEIYSVVDGARTRIGEANNINSMSYSANFGLGINYNVSEKIKVNVEPTFKYQINTFNNSSGDFQPYFIGIYTGLSYKF